MRNYLVRLSWAHGDDEIFSTQQAIEWFDGTSIGKSAARFDMVKLTSVNGHYIQESSNQRLVDLLSANYPELTFQQKERLLLGMTGLKQRAKTLVDLWDSAQIYVWDIPREYTEKAQAFLVNKSLLRQIWESISIVTDWQESSLHEWAKGFAETHGMKLGDVAQPIRSALAGSTVSPSVFEVAAIIGRELTEKRFQHALNLSD